MKKLIKSILSATKNKETAVERIYQTISDKYHFDIDTQNPLSDEMQTFMTIMEWINYEYAEGFQSASAFQATQVTFVLAHKLNMKAFADVLKKASATKEKYISNLDLGDYVTRCNLLPNDAEFQKCEQFYANYKDTLINNLHTFVQSNIEQF